MWFNCGKLFINLNLINNFTVRFIVRYLCIKRSCLLIAVYVILTLTSQNLLCLYNTRFRSINLSTLSIFWSQRRARKGHCPLAVPFTMQREPCNPVWEQDRNGMHWGHKTSRPPALLLVSVLITDVQTEEPHVHPKAL